MTFNIKTVLNLEHWWLRLTLWTPFFAPFTPLLSRSFTAFSPPHASCLTITFPHFHLPISQPLFSVFYFSHKPVSSVFFFWNVNYQVFHIFYFCNLIYLNFINYNKLSTLVTKRVHMLNWFELESLTFFFFLKKISF